MSTTGRTLACPEGTSPKDWAASVAETALRLAGDATSSIPHTVSSQATDGSAYYPSRISDRGEVSKAALQRRAAYIAARDLLLPKNVHVSSRGDITKGLAAGLNIHVSSLSGYNNVYRGGALGTAFDDAVRIIQTGIIKALSNQHLTT